MVKQTGTLFLSSLIGVLLSLIVVSIPGVVAALLGDIGFITRIPGTVITIAFFVTFVAINRFIFPRLSSLTARSGRILRLLKENGEWMAYEDIATGLGRAYLVDSDYKTLNRLTEQQKIAEKTEKVPGKILEQHFYRYRDTGADTEKGVAK